MKKISKIILLFLLIFSTSFSGIFNFGKKSKTDNQSGKLIIISTLFPVYDFAKSIAGDKAEVTLLLKPGMEAHSFDPTPRDIAKINNANLFIYTSKNMETWIEKIENSISNDNLFFVDSSEGIEFKNHPEDGHEKHEDHEDEHLYIDEHHEYDEHGDHEDEEHRHIDEHHEHDKENHGHEHGHGVDPHIWTDPLLAIDMAENIYNALVSVDSANTDYYRQNRDKLVNELLELDKDLESALKNVKSRTIVSGGHFAMAYFAERYNLKYISAYEGFSPNAEPKPKDVAKLRKFITDNNIKYIYYEELVNPKIAKVLADESGVEMLLLHGAHNVSKNELKESIRYVDIMRSNLKNLKIGLDHSD